MNVSWNNPSTISVNIDNVVHALTPAERVSIVSTLEACVALDENETIEILTEAFVEEAIPSTLMDIAYPPALADAQERIAYHIVHFLGRELPPSKDPKNVAAMKKRDDDCRAIVVEEFANWSHQELVDNIIDRMSLSEILEFADETVTLREEHITDNTPGANN